MVVTPPWASPPVAALLTSPQLSPWSMVIQAPSLNSPSLTTPIIGRHCGQSQKEQDRWFTAQHKAAKASYPTATTSLEEASKPNTEPVLAVSEPVQHVSAPELTASVQDATTPVPVVIAPVSAPIPKVPEGRIH